MASISCGRISYGIRRERGGINGYSDREIKAPKLANAVNRNHKYQMSVFFRGKNGLLNLCVNFCDSQIPSIDFGHVEFKGDTRFRVNEIANAWAHKKYQPTNDAENLMRKAGLEKNDADRFIALAQRILDKHAPKE